MARLKERYNEEIRQQLIERFGYSSAMQAPRLQKITLNMGVGDAKQDSKVLDAATEQLATIAGQKPSVRRARKSIAQFKVREGMPVGLSVTLRRERAYEFLDRLMTIAIPRIRDFRGLRPTSFDGRGNYSLGVREQIIFPEIDYDSVDTVRGLVVMVTSPATPRPMPSSKPSACPSAARATPLCSPTAKTETAPDGEDVPARAPGAPREVQDPRVHPLPPLWPRPLGVPQVRRVPHLPARARAQRLRAGHDQELLVIQCR
jgi:large subunit ribosomal protein L5